MQLRFIHTIIVFLIMHIVLYGQKPVISYVTVVENGNVEINWIPKNTVQGYNIYRSKTSGNQGDGPIFLTTVNGADVFQYIDTEVDARIRSMAYWIQYLDSTPLSDPHYTIYLESVEFDSCSMTNTLRWKPYSGWTDSFWYNIIGNGIDITSSDQELDIDTVFRHSVQGGQDNTYRIQVEKQNGINAFSNYVTSYAKEKQTPAFLNINNLTYDGSSVGLDVLVDNTADLLGYSLLVSSNNTDFTEAEFVNFDAEESSISFTHISDNQPLYYKVVPVMVCNDTLTDIANAVRPIVLTPTSSDEEQVSLQWNASFIESINEDYSISITVDGAQKASQETNTTSTSIVFNDFDDNNTAEVFCFAITATDENGYISTSNEICVSRKAKIEAPTGFTPNGDGVNDYFGPFWQNNNDASYIKNAIVDKFELVIYDKYGGAVFKTDKSFKLWNGTVNYRPVTEGGYIYYLEFTTAQGKSYKKSGTINVVYP